MKYGILGDIHANWEAFEVVLEAMERAGAKKYISVGDLVGYGANPIEVIDKVRALGTLVVAGNHDHAAVGKLPVDFFNTYARDAALWTRRILRKEDHEYLGGLPLALAFDGCTLVHSSLHSPELFEYIQTSYDAHLSLENQRTPVCFFGHSHVPVNFFKRRTVTYNTSTEVKIDPTCRTLINVGSIGQPRDENPDAACCVYDSDEAVVRILRVPYDIEKTGRKIRAAGLPDVLAERLKYGR